MKNILLAFLVLISIQSYGNNSDCEDVLSNEQWKIFKAGNTVNDPVVYEFSKIPSYSFTDQPAEKINWNQAKQLILLGVIKTAIQSHNLEITIISNSGRKYTSKEPKIDEILNVIEKVDPCFKFIQVITE